MTASVLYLGCLSDLLDCWSIPGKPLLVENPQVLVYRVQYKLCELVQGSAPSRLQNAMCPVASAESRRRLRSASSADLIVPATRRTTMGDRAFAVAAPRAWNSLPDAIRLWLS